MLVEAMGARDPARDVAPPGLTGQPPALQQLGIGLARRADECVRRVRERMDGRRPPEPSQAFLERSDGVRWLATLLIARWLYTGREAEDAELAWISGRGEMAAAEGLPLVNVIRGTLHWRDTVIAILEEEAVSRYVARDPLREALAVVRQSCDASLVTSAAAYDRRLAAGLRQG